MVPIILCHCKVGQVSMRKVGVGHELTTVEIKNKHIILEFILSNNHIL